MSVTAPVTTSCVSVSAPFPASIAASIRAGTDSASPGFAGPAVPRHTDGPLSFFFLVCLVLAVVTTPLATFAQESDPWASVEEMIVVGTGTAQLFQNEEVSNIAFDADYLEAIGASDLGDIAQFTPNLEIRTPFAASNPTLFIRGVGLRDFNANSSSSVAVYNDEIYMNSPAAQLAQLFDVENIDVLRGPQASTYGRNASAGVIRVIAKKPSGTPGAKFDVTYGSFNQIEIEGAVETVLVPDLISVRTSGRINRRDGITHNRCGEFVQGQFGPTNSQFEVPGAPAAYNDCFNPGNIGGLGNNRGPWVGVDRAPVKRWVNDKDNWAARTIIRITPDFYEMDWLVNFHIGSNRGDSRQFQVIGANQAPNALNPDPRLPLDANGYRDSDLAPATDAARLGDVFSGDVYEGDYNNVDKERLDLYGGSLHGQMTIGNFTLSSITGAEYNKRDVIINLDGNPYIGLEPRLKNRAYQITQEFRLDWDGGEGLDFQIGGMYLYESLLVRNRFVIETLLPGTDQRYTFLTRYGTGWVSGTWEPAEDFSLAGGVRLNYEDKEIDLNSQRFLQRYGRFVRFDPSRPRRFGSSATGEFGVAGEISANYLPTEDVTLYLKYVRGWKGPHINGGVANPGQQNDSGTSLLTPIKPEKIDSIELGMKSHWWEQRIKANMAVFYYDYQDIQVFQLQNSSGGIPVQELLNGDDADVIGVEMDFNVKPFEGIDRVPALLDGLWFNFAFAWLESKYTDFVNQRESLTNNGQKTITREDFSGNRLINSPRFSFVGFVAWPIPTPYGAFVPRFDWSFKDDVFFSPANIDLISQNALWIMNLRLTYKSPSENFEVSGFVQNLTDQSYIVDTFNLARLRRSILYAIGDPRTFGVTVKVNF